MKPEDLIDSTSYNIDDNDNDNVDINDDEYDSYDLTNIKIDNNYSNNDDNEMIIDDNDDINNNNIIDLLRTINSYRKRNNIMKMKKCIHILLDLIS